MTYRAGWTGGTHTPWWGTWHQWRRRIHLAAAHVLDAGDPTQHRLADPAGWDLYGDMRCVCGWRTRQELLHGDPATGPEPPPRHDDSERLVWAHSRGPTGPRDPRRPA